MTVINFSPLLNSPETNPGEVRNTNPQVQMIEKNAIKTARTKYNADSIDPSQRSVIKTSPTTE